MKARILHILQREDETISGEELSSRLGVSRVTVWKHVKALQELGYDIVSGPKGYTLQGENDFLYPWEFGERQGKIHYHDVVASTMDTARELARKGAADQSVVIAGIQQKGRGRMQREWFSRKGGLYFTLILRPKLPAVSGFLVNFITSTALVETVRDLTGLDARVKWPNDILLGEKKLCGMLSEMEAEGEMVTFINIGIGINVNNDPQQDEPKATSLARELGRKISCRGLLADFLNRLEGKLNTSDFDNCVMEWKKYAMTIGRRVKIVTYNGEKEGKALDVDGTGSLLLELDDGTREKVIYGDCFHL